jgi:general secretion pathway protein J
MHRQPEYLLVTGACRPGPGKGQPKTPTGDGFTLLEILVALILVSMVTLTVALAFKIGVGAWERGVKEGEDPQVRMIIPLLIQRQTVAAVKTNVFNGAILTLPFCGEQGSFSFFTSYAPEGSPRQGLMRVSWVFNQEEQTLLLYEQTITRRDDVKDESNPLSKEWAEKIDPISETKGITVFELRYAAVEGGLTKEPEWKETWDCNTNQWPELVQLRFQAGEGSRARAGTWIFRIGMMGMEGQAAGGTQIRNNFPTVGGRAPRAAGH